MDDLVSLTIALFTWGFIWIIPAGLAGNRRKNSKPIYPVYLITALVIEISISLLSLQLTKDNILIVALAPLIGAAVGSYFYWKATNIKDNLNMS